jgi:hypothetical protein
MPWLRPSLALVAALAALAACSSGSTAGSATPGAPASQTGSAFPETGGTEAAGVPRAEPGGPERPRPPETGGIAVDYPRGQAGNRAIKDLGDGRVCVVLTYLTNGVSVPPQVRLAIAGVGLENSPGLTVQGAACAGSDTACTPGFAWAAGTEDDIDSSPCSVIVRRTGAEGGEAEIAVRVKPSCAAGQEPVCAEFLADLESQGGRTVTVTVPGAGTAEDPSGGEDEPPAEPDPGSPGSTGTG